MRVRLEVVGVGDLDLNGDIPLQTTYAIADISEPEKRKAAFSKSILLPGTKNNNKIFGQIFEIDIYSDFNPNLKTDIILYVDGLENLRGVLRLVDISRVGDRISYNVTITGGIGGIYSAIGDDFLTDLDFSSLDHTYNKANIITSWTAAIGSGYVYPMIDYGNNNGVDWKVEDFYPSVYAKEYIDKIFAAAGYSYTSSFFDSDRFKRFIIPYEGGTLRLSEDTITLNTVDVESNAKQTVTAGNSAGMLFQTENIDNNNLFALFGLVPKVSGSYKVSLNFVFEFITGVLKTDVRILYYPPGSAGTPKVLWQMGGVNTRTSASVIPGVGIAVTAYPLPFDLQAGGLLAVSIDNSKGADIDILTGATLTAKIFNADIKDGETTIMDDAIPRKVKQKDLLQSIIKMFNLYVEPDKDNANNLLIEPRDDFYAGGGVKDWTLKHDTSKALQIKPMGDINANRYIYKYKDGRDYYNKEYKDNFDETYGTRTIETINDFVRGTKETSVIFSPTPLVKDDTNDRIISSMSPSHISNVVDKHPGSNIRLLYWAGTIGAGNAWNLIEGDGTKTSYTIYPYAGHLDNPYAPNFDLNFGAPKEVYYSTTSYTASNVFSVYHKQYLEDIIDVNSKIVTGYFYLTSADINLLDFRDEFVVGTHRLRLLKVHNYDAMLRGVTKCDFLRVRAKPDYTDTSTTSNGGFLTVLDGTALYQTPAITR